MIRPTKTDYWIVALLYENFGHEVFDYRTQIHGFELNKQVTFGDLHRLMSYGILREVIHKEKRQDGTEKYITIGWQVPEHII